ncbi:peptidase inhibitor family I36 protein [Paenibacillus sp. TAB 01]|uniref:peptidase inhibitor family I36 protein n=1 Tax=Paenibacillus sp. TAB 01 TaxID=3368988 RepID=UPI00375337FD
MSPASRRRSACPQDWLCCWNGMNGTGIPWTSRRISSRISSYPRIANLSANCKI